MKYSYSYSYSYWNTLTWTRTYITFFTELVLVLMLSVVLVLRFHVLASPCKLHLLSWNKIYPKTSLKQHELNGGSCGLHIDRVWVGAIIQAWGECLVCGLSNWEIHTHILIKCSHIPWLVRDTIFTTKIVSSNNVIRCLQATCQQPHL